MADITEAIRRLIFEYKSEGADQVMQTQEAVAASTTQTDKASLSLEKSFGNLERRYVETVRHQQAYEKVQRDVNAAVAQNPALQERANVVLAAASDHFDRLASNANKGGIASSFLSKALSTIIGPAGLIGIALTAVTAAVVYLTEKFQIIPHTLDLVARALAGIGFGQAAQGVTEYAQRMRDVTAAAEAQKAALDKIHAAHPRISNEVAKQLQLQEAQLRVAQARTPEEKMIADLLLKEVQYNQENKTEEEKRLLLAGDRKIAEAGIANAADKAASTTRDLSTEASNANTNMENVANSTGGVAEAMQQVWNYACDFNDELRDSRSLAESVADRLDMLGTQFKSIAPEGGSAIQVDTSGKEAYYNWIAMTGGEQAAQAARGRAASNASSAFKTHQELVEAHNELIKSNEDLTKSTDSLNATMQSALSPFYSQDPRTTKLGFRAGVTGNPDWMTGAGNANPLVAVLGPGATAPGMASGGSFTVGGGYSASDNRMAVFPVASGEEIVVNRNREGGRGQVVNIDNRIIVTGSVDEDALSKMKVSRYQQAQRMRAGLAG